MIYMISIGYMREYAQIHHTQMLNPKYIYKVEYTLTNLH